MSALVAAHPDRTGDTEAFIRLTQDRDRSDSPTQPTACATCGLSTFMEPSRWGHHAILVCENPRCIYVRTAMKSLAQVPMEPLRVEHHDPNAAEAFGVRPEILLLAGRHKAQRLVLLLADGRLHAQSECQDVLRMTALAVQQLTYRLRLRGFDIRVFYKNVHHPCRLQLVAIPATSDKVFRERQDYDS